MNRFDVNFNNVDPETSRPFSSGHLDGAWIISIVYGFLLFFATIAALYGLYQTIMGNKEQLALIGAGVIAYVLFFPPMPLLFRRSKMALSWCLGLFALCVIALIASVFSGGGLPIPLILAVLAQGYVCFYIYGLVKDSLLFK